MLQLPVDTDDREFEKEVLQMILYNYLFMPYVGINVPRP